MLRRTALILALTVAVPAFAWAGETSRDATLYKNPQCGCCEEYAEYLCANGFTVRVVPTHDLSLIKRQQGVPSELEGCHTTLIDGYVVESHVPVGSLERLLAERPDVKGISLPGMPQGSPGMVGEKAGPLTIYEIGEDGPAVFAVE